ncbi:MAG: hypothetical protein IJT18_08070 [Oscillospiraceae bacterium]|nr:hypothetical protein [Oscillospiraceae bacterium]
MDNERSTDVLENESAQGGDPARVVDAQEESRYEDDYDFGDGQDRTVDDPEDGTDGGETLDNTEESSAGVSGAATSGGKKQQSREENAAIRAARLKASREAREQALKETDAEIAAAGVLNPYTQKPFESMKDFREYAAQVKRASYEEIAEKTGRSVAELEEDAANREFLSSLRKQAQAAKEPQENDETAFIRRDVQDFLAAYPDMDADKLAALEQNASFRKFCGSRFGREPLAELYGSYLELVGQAGDAAAARERSKAERSTGGGSTGGVTLTPAQQKSLDDWNRANPDMQMTAKEFLQR